MQSARIQARGSRDIMDGVRCLAQIARLLANGEQGYESAVPSRSSAVAKCLTCALPAAGSAV